MEDNVTTKKLIVGTISLACAIIFFGGFAKDIAGGIFDFGKLTGQFPEWLKTSGGNSAKGGFLLEIKWVDAGGLSDGNIAASVGCPTIDGLGPTGGNMHAKTEYLVVDSVVPKCNLVLKVIKKLFAL